MADAVSLQTVVPETLGWGTAHPEPSREQGKKLPSAESFKQQKYFRVVRCPVAFTQPLISTTEMHTPTYVLVGKAEFA